MERLTTEQRLITLTKIRDEFGGVLDNNRLVDFLLEIDNSMTLQPKQSVSGESTPTDV